MQELCLADASYHKFRLRDFHEKCFSRERLYILAGRDESVDLVRP
jgi:hypothetical protein